MREEIFALKNIDFNIEKGESVGIIGSNGSGKSTLLKILCGVTAPTGGSVCVDGKISALLELGTGFNPEYTGISNIYLNGTLNGLKRAETKELIPFISEFADIGGYLSKPVKTYSDGMFLRLAFACAVAICPDILIIDEALAVGDFAFRQKCFAKIKEMRASGTTIILVSHDIDAIRRFCGRAIWLENGEIRQDGDVRSVSASYMEAATGAARATAGTAAAGNDCISRFGSDLGTITSIAAAKIYRHGGPMRIAVNVNVPGGIDLDTFAVSVAIKNEFGLDITVLSTADGYKFKKFGRHKIEFTADCCLIEGEYSLAVSAEDRAAHPIKYYEYADGAAFIRVTSDTTHFGVFHTPTELTVYEQD